MKNIAKFFNHSQKNSRILSNDCRKILQISRSFGKKIAKLVKQVRKLLTILNKWLQNKIVNFICWLKMSIRKLQILSNERGIKKWISWNDHRIKLWISLVGHGNNCEVCQVDLEKKKWIFFTQSWENITYFLTILQESCQTNAEINLKFHLYIAE